MLGTHRLYLYIFGLLAAVIVIGCGSSSGGPSSNNGGIAGAFNTPLGNGSSGGPSQPGPGTGAPAPFVPGGGPSPGPGPTPTPAPTPPPATLGLYVRAGATGDGSLNNPRGDLAGALEEAQAGQTVTLLYSPDPLQFGNNFDPLRLTIPDGVSLVGETGPGGVLTEVQGLFSVGDNVTISNFASSRFTPPINFDLTGAHNVTFSGMKISGSASLNDVSGRIEFLDCDLNGASYNGQISSGQADIVINACRLDGTVFNLTSNGSGTVLNFDYLGSTASERTYIYYHTGATGNVRVEDNILSYPSRTHVEHNGGSSGNVTFSNNTIVESGDVGGGGLHFQNRDETSGSGTILVRNNNAVNCNGDLLFSYIEGGNYDILALDNTSSHTGTGPFTDMQTTVFNSSRVRVRAENNTFSQGMQFRVAHTAVLDAGVQNNRVGISTYSGGSGRRLIAFYTMPVGFSGQINAIIQNNTSGTAAFPGGITIQRDAATVAVERLGSLDTDNNLNGSVPVVATGVTNAPDGSTSLPPIP